MENYLPSVTEYKANRGYILAVPKPEDLQQSPKVLLTTVYYTKCLASNGHWHQCEPDVHMRAWRDHYTEVERKTTFEDIIQEHEEWVNQRLACGARLDHLARIDYVTQKVVSA
jgi:hypothetical protein